MVHTAHLKLRPQPPFSLELTARSNGWFELLPNVWDGERHALQRVQRLGSGQVVLLTLTGAEPGVDIQVDYLGELSQAQHGEITGAVERMLRVDEDLSEFYSLCRERGGKWLEVTHGLGRLLRSPTVFEDAVKTICCTNTIWGGTKGMVKRLVNTYGEPYPANPTQRAFPTPEALAAVPFDAFKEAVRMGYRAEYVHTLAGRVASRELDLEALRDPAIPTAAVRKRLLAIKGVGAYAAANLLTLLGRYDELAVDTAFRTFVSREYFGGQQPSDKEAQAVYADWGRWKYLAFWFEIWKAAQERSKR